MAGIYSHRFIATATAGNTTYTVPAGNTAVVRSISVSSLDTTVVASYSVWINPGGFYIALGYLPIHTAAVSVAATILDMRHALAGGEILGVSLAANVTIVVSGYLFIA
jgi:hypothetical protein